MVLVGRESHHSFETALAVGLVGDDEQQVVHGECLGIRQDDVNGRNELGDTDSTASAHGEHPRTGASVVANGVTESGDDAAGELT